MFDQYVQLQEEKLEIRESELRQLSAKLETTKGQLEALRKAKVEDSSVEHLNRSGSRSQESEKRQLQSDLKELEAVYSQLELAKKVTERENQRLKIDLSDKDKEIQVSDTIWLDRRIPRKWQQHWPPHPRRSRRFASLRIPVERGLCSNPTCVLDSLRW